MTNKKSLASHKSLGRREVDVQVNVEKKVKTHSFEGEPTAIDTESTVLKRERATGTVSSVVLCQSGYVANGLKFVGQFEILHLSGSFTHTEVGGKNRRIGKLSISLSKPDGQVFGGVVVGPLIAATPIQGGSIKLISTLNFYKKNYIIKISLNKIINRYKIINLNKLNHDKPLPL
ncbi:hypothetical protein ACOSQ3_016363 [Xanthoceras sorbifolium]